MTRYAIRGGEEGRRRLDLLADIMAPGTEALLAAVGVRPGMRCLDFGCGGGHVSRLLAHAVGDAGSVVGIDLDDVKLTAAREGCRERGVSVDFRQGDLAGWSEPAAYDLVYGRFILSHLSDRPGTVASMVAALRPAGLLVLEDIDFTGSFSYPANDAFQRYCALYRQVIARRGGDADLGPQLYALCVGAGLDEVSVRVVQPTHAGRAPGKDFALTTLVNITDAAIAEGLATPDEIQDLATGLTQLVEDERSIVSQPRIFQVWGRRRLAGRP